MDPSRHTHPHSPVRHRKHTSNSTADRIVTMALPVVPLNVGQLRERHRNISSRALHVNYKQNAYLQTVQRHTNEPALYSEYMPCGTILFEATRGTTTNESTLHVDSMIKITSDYHTDIAHIYMCPCMRRRTQASETTAPSVNLNCFPRGP